MNYYGSRGIRYAGCLVALVTVFAVVSYSQQSKSKAAPSPKFSRDWTRVAQRLQRLSWMMNDAGMLQYARSVGLETHSNKVPDFQSFRFDDPVTHQTVLWVSIYDAASDRSAAPK
jgi:hypothetical protein